MIDTDVMVTPPPTTTPPPAAKVDAPFMAAPKQPEKKPVPLDMGEASREQGFRLNGCR
jgi:hypothetical protein